MKCLIIYTTLSLVLLGCIKHAPESNDYESEEPSPKLVPLVSRYTRAGHIDFVPYHRIPNLSGYPKEEKHFMVPEGTVNVALNKPVFSSCENPIMGKIEMITDGIMTCRRGMQVYYADVELESGIQHITIDLKGEHQVYAIRFWHCYPMNPVYFDIIVQVADDLAFTKNVRILFNNDHDNSIGLGSGTDKNYIEAHGRKLVDAKGINTRYVRLYSNGNWTNEFNHYAEVEVYGKPIN